MTIEIETASDAVLAKLRVLAEAANTPRQVSEDTRARVAAIQHARDYLSDRSHRIAFVGQMGIGKSSMIAVLSQLVLGDTPRDRNSLRQRSVLAVGAGGTTVCEVRIRAASPKDPHPFGLLISPLSIEAMREEIRLFAFDEWEHRRGPNQAGADENRRSSVPREVNRAIRNMMGLANMTSLAEQRTIDPLDDIINRHDSPNSLATHLIDRASLLSRTETTWWWSEGDNVYGEMKQRFDDLNHGRNPTAMLPQSITLVVPAPLPGFTQGIDIELIDTRGFDSRLGGRPDIQEVLRNPRTLVVLCTPFREAPGEGVRNLLKDIQDDVEFRQAAARIMLVLMDHGDAESVNGADGNRVFGQGLRKLECSRGLRTPGRGAFVSDEQIVAYDALQDDRESMVANLVGRIAAMRASMLSLLEEQVRDANSFLDNVENKRVELARTAVDKRLKTLLAANSPSGSPLRDPLKGLYEAIRDWPHASQVYASCRRNGSYPSMDAYAAVRSGASRAATEWLAKLDTTIQGTFRALELDNEFAAVREHLRLRRGQYDDQRITFVREYADRVQQNVEKALLPDNDAWEDCAREWGGGPGFKNRVAQHLESWSSTQTGLHAHEQADLSKVLPIALEKSSR
jgi:hypothetical protein